MKKRLISILLLAVLLLTLLPAVSLAEEAGDGGEAPPAEPDPVPGTAEPAEPDPAPGTEEPTEPAAPDEPATPADPQPAGGQTDAGGAAPAAADPEKETGTPGNLWGIPADDVIWYGFYDEKPVAWLVLDDGQTNMGTEGVYLLSRDLIDIHKVVFDEDSPSGREALPRSGARTLPRAPLRPTRAPWCP